MRNPISLLAAALVCASPLYAADLPSWTSVEEPWGSWRVVNFTDSAGQGHELWCRWGECGWNRTSGRAKLYVFERAGSEYYEYKEHWYSRAIKSSKTTYSTMLSHYELDMTSKPHKAVVPGTDQSFPVEDRAQLTPTGYMIRVMAPSRVADDLAARTPTAEKKPGGSQRSWNPGGRSSNGTGSTPRSGSNAGVGGAVAKPAPAVVSDAEKKWLTFPEKAAYESALKSHLGKGQAKRSQRLKDYRDARAKIAVNLADREGGSKKYAGMTASDSVVAKAIDDYLSGLDAYGAKDQTEIQLTTEELAKLSPLKDGSGVIQKASYDKEMGAADAKDVVLRHRITVKYRILIPSAKSDATGALTADEVERLKGLKLYDDYQKDLAAAGGDPAKLAEVYKKYRDKIAAAPGQPRSLEELFRSRLTGDDLAAFNKDLATAKTDAEKNAVYDKYLARLGKISDKDLEDMPIEARKPFCDRLKANSKAGTATAPAKTAHEQARNIDTGKTDFDRGSKTMTLVTAGASGGGSLVASNENLRNAYAKCIALDAKDATPSGRPSDVTGHKPVPPPKGSAKTDATTDAAEKPKDPNLFRNLAQAMTGGLFGLILGSFFGGPLVMAGFAVALGAGSYLLSQHFNPPPKKGKGDGDG